MIRRSLLVLALLPVPLLAARADAQPTDGDKPRPPPLVQRPPQTAPSDPYADPAPKPKPKPATPDDPYAAPLAEAPLAEPAAPPRKTKGKKPATGPKTRTPGPKPAPSNLPVDPYGAAPNTPDDPYAETGPIEPAPDRATGAGLPTDRPADRAASPPKAPPRAPVAAIPEPVSITDLVAVQGLLAVQRLDGWLLFDDRGENAVAASIVKPPVAPNRAWFYLLPAKGEPIGLVHSTEPQVLDHLPGKKLTYTGYRDLDRQLRTMVKGLKTVATETPARGRVIVGPGTSESAAARVRALRVQLKPSDTLVQYARAIWGEAGRTAHFVAAHHLTEVRKDALAFVAKAIQSRAVVTEYDVQQRILRSMTMRGLVAEPPIVAAGVNTANPGYVPSATRSSPIQRGDLLVLRLAGKLAKPDGVWAAQTWVAAVDLAVPERAARVFQAASLARDQALALIADRSRKRRPVTGAEVDDAARAFLKKAGFADQVAHRTGHSIDRELQGAGANLDNLETKDTRIITPGTGFTIGPGVYFAGELGIRTEVSVYLSPGGPEVTTPAQDDIEVLLAK